MKNNRKIYTGRIIQYDGSVGVIEYEKGTINFTRDNIINNEYPCRNDIVKFSIKFTDPLINILSIEEPELVAYNIQLVRYGNFRTKDINILSLGHKNIQIGVIKWYNSEICEGIIINLFYEEFYWKDNTYLSHNAKPGDIVIFKAIDTQEKKEIEICRHPQLLEDWEYVKNIKDELCDIIISPKSNPFTKDLYDTEKIAQYNIKIETTNKILNRLNLKSFKNEKLLTDIILYNASHSDCMKLPINEYRSIYHSKNGFHELCQSVYEIIKNYRNPNGAKQLFEFVFKLKLIPSDYLYSEEAKKVLKIYIDSCLKVSEGPFGKICNHFIIPIENYKKVCQIIKLLKKDSELYIYFINSITNLLDFKSLALLIITDDTPIAWSQDVQNKLYRGFMNTIGIHEISSFSNDQNLENYRAPKYGVNLQYKFFYRYSTDYNITIPKKFSNVSFFDVLRIILNLNDNNDDKKAHYLKIIFLYSNHTSQQMIIKDSLFNDYMLPSIWDSIPVMKALKDLNVEFYWQLFNSYYATLSIFQKLYLWLYDLNNIYNYHELIEASYILSTEERKKLNKKIIESAKEERYLSFLEKVRPCEVEWQENDEIIYICKHKNIYYLDSKIIIFINKETSLPSFPWESAREEWNWLTNEYLNRKKIKDLRIFTKKGIITRIEGLENIEERIIIADIQHNGTETYKTKINKNQINRIIHNVSARNKCIDFISRQESQFNVLDIQELISNQLGEIKRDISFMFIIPNERFAYIIWESVEYDKSKATYIFRANLDSALSHAKKIKIFIESNLYIRSRLHSSSSNDDIKTELNFYARINHDSERYEIWEERMKECLPFLK